MTACRRFFYANTMRELQEHFNKLVLKYSSAEVADDTWQQIATAYNAPNRHYHNLTHLQSLIDELLPVQHLLNNYEAVLFALFYHDIVYSTLRKDNESQSAAFAGHHLSLHQVPQEIITLCQQHILATADHKRSETADTNYFTDADLSILGAPASVYQAYCYNIRREYACVPAFFYKKGRNKVIQHFLQMDSIFKTSYFYNRYEDAAKANLAAELVQLNA